MNANYIIIKLLLYIAGAVTFGITINRRIEWYDLQEEVRKEMDKL